MTNFTTQCEHKRERLTCTLAVPVVPLEPEGDIVALAALGARLAARAVNLAIVPDRRRGRRRGGGSRGVRPRRGGSPRVGPRCAGGARCGTRGRVARAAAVVRSYIERKE